MTSESLSEKFVEKANGEQGLPLVEQVDNAVPEITQRRKIARKFHKAIAASLVIYGLFRFILFGGKMGIICSHGLAGHNAKESSGICGQVEPLTPSNHPNVSDYLNQVLFSESYKQKSVNYLSGLIQIPSESFDDLGSIEDDRRWDIFFKVEEYLKTNFPLVFDKLEVEHVNVHGLVFTWKGTDAPDVSKPILITAHQDVVPVLPATASQWKYPPFSGHFDGERIWGRGSTDDKNFLVGVMESLTLLLETDFVPKRTIIVAFGFDEEISGPRGAAHLAEHLEDIYGKDSIYLLIDEGSALSEQYGIALALPGVGEKGYVDLAITVTAEGGHASLPPDHTSIGIISEILQLVEANPFDSVLTTYNPIYEYLGCLSEYGTDFPHDISKALKGMRKGSKKAGHVAGKILSEEKEWRYLISTSQAIDKISGGIKINALPEAVTALINIRIAVESSIKEVDQHYKELLLPIAEKYDLEYYPFTDGAEQSQNKRKLIISNTGSPLEPAPMSPLDSEEYRLLSGTIRGSLPGIYDGKEIIVAPAMMTGNTDTRYYWNLTENIYRFSPISMIENMNHAHTVDEFVKATDHIYAVKFFADFILNADELA